MNLSPVDLIRISVTDFPRSADGYRPVLGFEVIHEFTGAWMVGHGLMTSGLAELIYRDPSVPS